MLKFTVNHFTGKNVPGKYTALTSLFYNVEKLIYDGNNKKKVDFKPVFIF